MQIGILHLTDLHFTANTVLDEKIDSLCRSIVHGFRDLQYVYLVLSGDLAFSGKKTEYEQVKSIIDEILSVISKDRKVKVIMVPGNHDCNYEHNSQLRKNTITSMNYETLGHDNSVLNNCISVQKEFWEFYQEYNPLPENKLLHSVIDEVGGYTVTFHCLNTSWMSDLQQLPGTLFFPVKNIHPKNEGADINISVYHHPTNWFTPETTPNNKREFEKLLLQISSVQLIGHEHETVLENKKDLDIQTSSFNFSGKIFHNSKHPEESGYQVLTLDLSSKNGVIKRYEWNNDIYVSSPSHKFSYNNTKIKEFTYKERYLESLNRISIPLLDSSSGIRLSDIFVYPHIESLEMNQKYMESYFDSKMLLNDEQVDCVILEGDSQIGKSSLLKMLCIGLYNKGKYPIFVNARLIKNTDPDKVFKKIFKDIFTNANNFDKFKQSDRKNKILIIDDFQDMGMTSARAQKFIHNVSTEFGRIIISIDTIHGTFPQMQSELEKFKLYTIKPLGHKKTNDLIINHHSLNQHPLSVERQVFLNEIKSKFDQVRVILGNKIIPSYPIFLLSILQSLENASIDLSETSYGYCYQSLIHYALASKAKVDNDDLNSYMNFIKELAYHFHINDLDVIGEDGFHDFYNEYVKKYLFLPYDTIKHSLLESQIITNENEQLKFGYKYILFFLAAKHISDTINTEEGKEIVTKLFDNLYSENNANILVFITHHSNDISFINDSMFNAMVPFENITPISLDKNDPYYIHLNEISKSISSDIIEQTRSPEQERDNNLVIQDENERELEKATENEGDISKEVSEATRPFLHAFRSIDIVGQIVKNRKGSLEKSEIEDLITEIYLTGFRTVGYLGNIFNEAKENLAEDLSDRVKDDDNRHEIEQKIMHFIQIISLQTCLGIFSKLIFAVGIKNLPQVYDNVAKNIGTPAAKLVTFGINSYYNDLSTRDVSLLVKEFKDNPVAIAILRSRVRAYIYTNHVDYRKKQSLAQTLGMKICPFKGKDSTSSLGFSEE